MVGSERTAIVAGINGQDGSYLAELLLTEGYSVVGLTRGAAALPGPNIRHLVGRVRLIASDYSLAGLTAILAATRPVEVYNLAGQSFVSKSWKMVEETLESQGLLTSRFLEAVLAADPSIRFLNASSSEIFDPADGSPLHEESPIGPYNPYGCAKALGHCMVDAYRKFRGLFAVNAILFPHESPRRDPNFAFKKILRGAAEIKAGRRDFLNLGNLDARRDWGYAPSYATAMYRMLGAVEPHNLCLCTGESHSVEDVVRRAFSNFGLDWRSHVEVDTQLLRVFEPPLILGNPARAASYIDWRPSLSFDALVDRLLDFEYRHLINAADSFGDEQPLFEERDAQVAALSNP